MSKKRTYSDAFLRYGFVNLPSGGDDRPQCVVCHKVLTNESLKPSKLSAHLQKCHPNLQNEDQAYFQRRAVALKNIQFGSSGIQAQKLQAAVEVSYFVAYKVAEQQKMPHHCRESDYALCIRDGKQADIFAELNSDNLQLQGQNTTVIDAHHTVTAFLGKLRLWIRRLEKGVIAQFPTLDHTDIVVTEYLQMQRNV
ncbi:protein FAM200B-like [Tachypleus tridentatus]|uniref:protein FAM200B-like n=1 Tax=Tachypleus tridentatus TaxID=6853 RepID=UPI003FD41894